MDGREIINFAFYCRRLYYLRVNFKTLFIFNDTIRPDKRVCQAFLKSGYIDNFKVIITLINRLYRLIVLFTNCTKDGAQPGVPRECMCVYAARTFL